MRAGASGTANGRRRYDRPMEVRLARQEDAEAIRAIYNAEVTGSTVTFDLEPRTAEEQRAGSPATRGRTPPSWPSRAAVVGFGSLSPFRDRAAYATTVEDSALRRRRLAGQGGGPAAARRARGPGRARGFHTVIARISGDNEPSIALHRGVRLRAGGRRARGGPQVRPLDRRRRHAADAVTAPGRCGESGSGVSTDGCRARREPRAVRLG